jgi:hypothetical protein
MSINCEMPPVVPAPMFRSRQRSYAEFFSALRSKPGEWYSIHLDDESGKTSAKRTSLIHNAARQRGLKIQVTVQGEKLYARLIVVPTAD